MVVFQPLPFPPSCRRVVFDFRTPGHFRFAWLLLAHLLPFASSFFHISLIFHFSRVIFIIAIFIIFGFQTIAFSAGFAFLRLDFICFHFPSAASAFFFFFFRFAASFFWPDAISSLLAWLRFSGHFASLHWLPFSPSFFFASLPIIVSSNIRFTLTLFPSFHYRHFPLIFSSFIGFDACRSSAVTPSAAGFLHFHFFFADFRWFALIAWCFFHGFSLHFSCTSFS